MTPAEILLNQPMDQASYRHLALELHNLQRPAAAARCYQTCMLMGLDPGGELLVPLAIDLLLAGEWKSGWKVMDHQRLMTRRLGRDLQDQLHKVKDTSWNGKKEGKEPLLVLPEQGFGDQLQSCRFILELQQKRPVQMLTRGALGPLLREGSDLKQVSDQPTQITSDTRWIACMSLLRHCWEPDQPMPHADGYINSDPKRNYSWSKALQRRPDHRLVALHWQGNTDHERNSFYARGRSFQFKEFKALSNCENIEYVSVQKGKASEQLDASIGLPIVKGQDQLNTSTDFRDTAAILSIADLVITSDSAVAHLAGALGRPCWLLLSYVPDWRWGLHGETTPWYKSMRLIRQKNKDDWNSVFKQVATDLKAWRNKS